MIPVITKKKYGVAKVKKFVVVDKPVANVENFEIHCVMCAYNLAIADNALVCKNPQCPNYGLVQVGIERMPQDEIQTDE